MSDNQVPSYGHDLRIIAWGMLTNWKQLPCLLSDAWDSVVHMGKELLPCLFCLMAPFLLPFAPLIAWYARKLRRLHDERRRTAIERYMRK